MKDASEGRYDWRDSPPQTIQFLTSGQEVSKFSYPKLRRVILPHSTQRSLEKGAVAVRTDALPDLETGWGEFQSSPD